MKEPLPRIKKKDSQKKHNEPHERGSASHLE